MVRLIDRRVPEAHHGVADVLVERAVVVEHDGRHLVEVVVQHRAERLDVHRFGQVREPLDVGEHDRHIAPLPAQREAGGIFGDLLCDGRGDVLRQRLEYNTTRAVLRHVTPR